MHLIGEKTDRVPMDVEVRFDEEKLSASVESIPLSDDGLRHMWGDSLNRIQFVVKDPARSGAVAISFSRVSR